MAYISRREQETTSSVVRRFIQRIQSSGILREAKANKYFAKPLNKNARRVVALEREKMRQHYRMMIKMGKKK